MKPKYYYKDNNKYFIYKIKLVKDGKAFGTEFFFNAGGFDPTGGLGHFWVVLLHTWKKAPSPYSVKALPK